MFRVCLQTKESAFEQLPMATKQTRAARDVPADYAQQLV